MDAETVAAARTIRDRAQVSDALLRSLRQAELDRAKGLAAGERGRPQGILGPPAPALVEISDIAKILGVSRQRAYVIAASADFPSPLAATAAGPVFLEAAVKAFAERP